MGTHPSTMYCNKSKSGVPQVEGDSYISFPSILPPSPLVSSQREYAIVGCEDGTSFVDVTEPTAPVVLGFLPTHTSSSLWRDIKVRSEFEHMRGDREYGDDVYTLFF